MSYIVRCALPAGHTITMKGPNNTSVPLSGQLGVAPSREYGASNLACGASSGAPSTASKVSATRASRRPWSELPFDHRLRHHLVLALDAELVVAEVDLGPEEHLVEVV